jgi:hypothetical protein
MSKASDAANAAMYAVEKTCELYGVETLRMQSRTVLVPGAAGRTRPLFFGQWRDQFGELHTRGMADLLLRPRVPMFDLMFKPGEYVLCYSPSEMAAIINRMKNVFVTVPVWVEVKSGRGEMRHDQHAFRNYVEWNGEVFFTIHEEMKPLTDWFDSHGVKQSNFPRIPKPVSVPVGEVADLPCRHCGDFKAQHTGTILACRLLHTGRVWSPKIPTK